MIDYFFHYWRGAGRLRFWYPLYTLVDIRKFVVTAITLCPRGNGSIMERMCCSCVITKKIFLYDRIL